MGLRYRLSKVHGIFLFGTLPVISLYSWLSQEKLLSLKVKFDKHMMKNNN